MRVLVMVDSDCGQAPGTRHSPPSPAVATGRTLLAGLVADTPREGLRATLHQISREREGERQPTCCRAAAWRLMRKRGEERDEGVERNVNPVTLTVTLLHHHHHH